MLSGRRAVDKNRPTGEQNLVEWAKPYMSNKRKIFRVLDTRMEGQYSLLGALKVANLALKCLSLEPKFRPTMNEVVVVLEQLQSSKDIERNSQAEPNTKRQNLNDRGHNSQKRTLNENNSARASYRPRPPASPLHTWGGYLTGTILILYLFNFLGIWNRHHQSMHVYDKQAKAVGLLYSSVDKIAPCSA